MYFFLADDGNVSKDEIKDYFTKVISYVIFYSS
jgi:hypothetical protein